MTRTRYAVALALLLLAALALLLPALGLAPLERAEIYFLDGARSMLERGDWLVPYYRDAPFFDKPPLTYWLQALAFRLLGPSPAAGRLVSVVAALLALASTGWLSSLLHDRRTALASVTVLATTFAFVGFGRIAMSDMLLAFLSTLAVALALVAYRGAAWAVPALGATLGLGFLTKGPIAVLLPGLGIAWLAWRRRHAGLPAAPRALALAALLFVVLGLGWFAALVPRFGLQPLQHFFLRENVQRFAGAAYDVGEPPWYYLVTYLGEGLPWSLFLPLAVVRAFGRRAAEDASEAGSRFVAVWLAWMLLLLSLSRGKIDYYLLPLYPGAALLVGHHLVGRAWYGLERAWARVALLSLAALLVLPAALHPQLPPAWLPGPDGQRLLAAVAGVGAAAAVAVALWPRGLRVLAVLGAATVALFGVAVGLYLPAFATAQPNAAIAADVARERRYVPGAQLVLCRDPARAQRDVLFRARLPVVERCDLWAFAAAAEPWMLLLTPEERVSLGVIPTLREVRRYPYLPADRFGLRGLLQPTRAGQLVLAANYPTDDPVAETRRRRERKRALRALDEAGLPHPE